MIIEKLKDVLVVKKDGLIWKFSGLEKDGKVGRSMGEEYANLEDEEAANIVIAEAKNLGLRGVKEGTDQAG